MEYLHLFETAQEALEAYNDNNTYKEPWVSCVEGEEESVLFNRPPDPVFNYHDYVDLGLPSGTLWATCNVGGLTPEQAGLPFAWGETETKDTFTMDNYKYANSSEFDNSAFTKYNATDGITQLLPVDDAASVNMGGMWRMPTVAQYEELMANGSFTYSSGVFTYTSNVNGNQMKIRFHNTGRLWLRDRDNADCKWAKVMEWMGSGSNRYLGTGRQYGYSVRGVVMFELQPVPAM